MSLPAKNVLLLDHDPNMRAVLQEMLTSIGVQTIYQVNTPDEAFKTLDKREVDLVIINDMSCQIDAPGFSARVRELESKAARPLPLILLMAEVDEAYLARAKDASISSVLISPFTTKQLKSCIKSVMPKVVELVLAKTYFGTDRRGESNAHIAPDERQNGRGSCAVA